MSVRKWREKMAELVQVLSDYKFTQFNYHTTDSDLDHIEFFWPDRTDSTKVHTSGGWDPTYLVSDTADTIAHEIMMHINRQRCLS